MATSIFAFLAGIALVILSIGVTVYLCVKAAILLEQSMET